MLTYTFEERGEKPYYQYLYEVLKEDIEEGRLKEGEHLPSKRAFAKQLGLSVMTIASAYEQLLVEGYIYAVEKKGYYVAAVQPYLTEPLHHEHKGKQELFLEANVDELKTLLEVALIQSTGASNRIEGISTGYVRV